MPDKRPVARRGAIGLIGATAIVAVALCAAPAAFAANASYAGTSANGAAVFFTTADKLVPGDTDGGHVDVYERSAGHTSLISTRNAPTDNGAFDAAYVGSTPDGSHVFFTTEERLVPGETDSSVDVYERTGSTTTLVSPGNDPSDATFDGVSTDGKHVFFSTKENLVPADTDGSHLDVYDHTGTSTKLISTKNAASDNGAFGADYAGSSTDGTMVFFETDEPLVAGDTDGGQQDVYERAGGSTTLISTKNATSDNGPNKAAFKGASADGSVVFFQTDEQLTASDTDSSVDIYRRASGTTTQISQGQINGNGAFDAAFRGTTPSGNAVFFVTAEPLASTDTDTKDDVYERAGSVTTHISQGPKHQNGHFDSTFDGASTDGSRVFFSTQGALVDTDQDSNVDVYERIGGTTVNPTTSIVSQNPDTGSSGPFDAHFTGSSTNGSRAFFESNEGMTPQAFDGGHTDVFAGSPSSLSLISAGGTGPFDALYGGSSTSGSKVFFTTAERLSPADTDSSVDVYQRFAGATTLISR